MRTRTQPHGHLSVNKTKLIISNGFDVYIALDNLLKSKETRCTQKMQQQINRILCVFCFGNFKKKLQNAHIHANQWMGSVCAWLRGYECVYWKTCYVYTQYTRTISTEMTIECKMQCKCCWYYASMYAGGCIPINRWNYLCGARACAVCRFEWMGWQVNEQCVCLCVCHDNIICNKVLSVSIQTCHHREYRIY